MEREGYRANAGDRCYFCKAELLDVLGPLAERARLRRRRDRHQRRRRRGRVPARASGRPPSAARSPRCATPASPRRRSAPRRGAWGLPTWDKPAAACLSSRVAYGIEVSPFRLARVERAEAAVRAALAAAGIDVRDLRVRDLGDRAALEVDADRLAEVDGLPGGARRRARRRLRRGRGRPARVPVRLDERAAARAGAVPLTRTMLQLVLPDVAQHAAWLASHRDGGRASTTDGFGVGPEDDVESAEGFAAGELGCGRCPPPSCGGSSTMSRCWAASRCARGPTTRYGGTGMSVTASARRLADEGSPRGRWVRSAHTRERPA